MLFIGENKGLEVPILKLGKKTKSTTQTFNNQKEKKHAKRPLFKSL